MKVTSDSIYVIGHGHRTCQDYACHGQVTWLDGGENVSYHYAVLSDGCSSSPNSDIGARLLSHAFLRVLSNEGMSSETGHQAIWLAHALRMQLGLPESALDATLLAIVADDETVWGLSYGDGIVSMAYNRYHLTYPSGAPVYLNYMTNQSRDLKFQAEFGLAKKSEYWLGPEERVLSTNPYPSPMYRHPIHLLTEGFHVFAVVSDGIDSFSCQNEPIPTMKATERLFAWKTYNGEFVTRRVMRFLQDTSKEGWKHFDDLSMAALAIQVEPK